MQERDHRGFPHRYWKCQMHLWVETHAELQVGTQAMVGGIDYFRELWVSKAHVRTGGVMMAMKYIPDQRRNDTKKILWRKVVFKVTCEDRDWVGKCCLYLPFFFPWCLSLWKLHQWNRDLDGSCCIWRLVSMGTSSELLRSLPWQLLWTSHLRQCSASPSPPVMQFSLSKSPWPEQNNMWPSQGHNPSASS